MQGSPDAPVAPDGSAVTPGGPGQDTVKVPTPERRVSIPIPPADHAARGRLFFA